MSKSKTKKGTAKAAAKKALKPHEGPPEIVKSQPREKLCVFAFRLTAEERDAIHKAAGPAKASQFARTLLVAAARNDEAAVKAILKGIQATS